MTTPRTIAPIAKKPAKPLLVTPNELADFATDQFGTDWRAPLARALYVDVRTVYRWEQEETAIPGPVKAWMETMARKHPLQRRRKAS